MDPVWGTIGSADLPAPHEGLARNHVSPPLSGVRAPTGHREVGEVPVGPVNRGRAEGLLDGLRHPRDDALVGQAEYDVADVLRQQPELLLRGRDPGRRVDPLGDITPGDDDQSRPDAGRADVVVPLLAGELRLVRVGVENHRFAGRRHPRVDVHQTLVDHALADEPVPTGAEKCATGRVDVSVNQIDHASVAPDGLENDLRIEHRVGGGADQPRRLYVRLHRVG